MCAARDSRWNTMLLIGSIHFTATVCVALQAPFYPQEAEKKGASATEYGLVFGIFELVSFVACPIFGKYLDALGAKCVLTAGAFLTGLSCIAFGMLDMVEGHWTFIVLSFATRSAEAIGASAVVTAAFAIAANKYPEKVATSFATLDIFYGLGYTIGPTVGGYLFQVGGYILPFAVTGGSLIISSVTTAMFLEIPRRSGHRPSLVQLMTSPGVILNSFVTVACAITMGFYSATLEPHLRQFDLSPSAVGAMFVISGSLYAVLTLPIGKLVDYYVDPKHVVICGAVLSTFGAFLIGPADFVPLKPTLWMCILGLVCHGVAIACLTPPTFADSISSAVRDGFPDDMTTHALISGLWASSFALGGFIGPSVAGYLLDTVGFRRAIYFIIAINTAVVIAEIPFVCARLPRFCCLFRRRRSTIMNREVAQSAFAANAISSLTQHGPKSLCTSAVGKLGSGHYDTFGHSVPVGAV